eukprot:CAMPEP_0168524272 /NCGR_PEP_ID=MMETSP0405-20121227/10545_1 /TAXON_ID=498012 /ORGANISM="Trichosphaerium sp, Strain Am-I-7 wt" /LENGTH=619 /DNA_ID=CAMNT_0008546435 /DNA_START=191 /DNA_END=2050 /DNA_ORIENTATION=+
MTLARLSTPYWVFDIKNKGMLWANDAAITLWAKNDLNHLLKQDFKTDMSDATKARLLFYEEEFAKNKSVEENWNFYPNGVPTRATCICRGIQHNGVTVMLVEAIPEATNTIKAEEVRIVESMRHLNSCVCLFDEKGEEILYQNPISFETYGNTTSLSDLLVSDEDIFGFLQTESIYQGECRMNTKKGQKWFLIKVQKLNDPITGKDVILMHSTSIEMQKKAESSVQYTKDFLAYMSHEIRTPLNAVIGSAEIMVSATASDKLHDELDEALTTIRSSALSLLNVVNGILDISKIAQGGFDLVPTQFKITDCVQNTYNTCKLIGKAQQVTLNKVVCEELETQELYQDKGKLEQVLINLISNAIRFTPEGGVVTLKVSQDDKDMCTFSVSDTGCGVPEDKINSLFVPYFQVGQQSGGTGLGLNISEKIVSLMGGELKVDSTVGKGSTFYFSIPSGPDTGIKKRLSPREMVDLEKNQNTTLLIKKPKEKASKMSILVVDDNSVNRLVCVALLKTLGYHNTYTAVDGQNAIDLWKEKHHDVILMDYEMPVKNGLAATKEIRSMCGSDVCPIIVAATANVLPEHLTRSLESGSNLFLGKPYTRKGLEDVLTECFYMKYLRIPNTK